MPASIADPTVSGADDVSSGLRFHKYNTIITPTKEIAFNTNAGPTPINPTTSPPSAGPAARARLNPMELSPIAAGNSDRGTSSGTIACHAGPFIGAPSPTANATASSVTG